MTCETAPGTNQRLNQMISELICHNSTTHVSTSRNIELTSLSDGSAPLENAKMEIYVV